MLHFHYIYGDVLNENDVCEIIRSDEVLRRINFII